MSSVNLDEFLALPRVEQERLWEAIKASRAAGGAVLRNGAPILEDPDDPTLVLRPPRQSDKHDRLAVGRQPEFVRMVGGNAQDVRPLAAEQVERWYSRLLAEPFEWVIDVGGCCVGTARLHHMDLDNHRARYAIGIFDPGYWGKGIGTRATRLVLKHAFLSLRLHRVDLRVLDFNHRAIHCYQKCGFTTEGVERESAYIGGQWCSDVFMSILESEYAR